MRRHHRADALIDGSLERRKLDRLEALRCDVENRHLEMRIGRDIAVSRKVFCGRDQSVFLCAADVRPHEGRNLRRIFAERANIDDRIERIVLHVGDRVEIDAYSDGPRLLGRQLGSVVRDLRIAGRTDRHRERQPRRAEEHVTRPALEIGGDQQRQLRLALHLVEHQRHRRRIAAESVIAADVKIGDVAAHDLEVVALQTSKSGVGDTGKKHLPDLFVERHRPEGFLDPACRGGLQPACAG